MYRPFPLFIGLRYTRARRRNHFISFITVISLLGIVLGVTALITVLSVMNGFHKEVRSRILGMASHAEILSVRGGITNWRDAIATATADRRVVGAAPFVESQVMLVNGPNVSGAILRGVLPAQEPEVSDVGEHISYPVNTPPLQSLTRNGIEYPPSAVTIGPVRKTYGARNFGARFAYHPKRPA